MEITMLLILFYLSQNPEFINAVKPISEKLKNSEEMLRFMKDLSRFSELFGSFSSAAPPPPPCDEKKKDEKKEPPRSPTGGIADDFIEKCLSDYFKRGKNPR
jgi:hypothetical protein